MLATLFTAAAAWERHDYLAWQGCTPVDRSLDAKRMGFCLSDRISSTFRSSFVISESLGWRAGSRPVVLEIKDWSSHRLVARMAEILLREFVGVLDVMVNDYTACPTNVSGAEASYQRLARGGASHQIPNFAPHGSHPHRA